MLPSKDIKLTKNSEASTSKPVHANFSPSAGASVAKTCELVVIILLHLSYKDLLRCLQVSPTWRDFIGGSAKLQRLLYKVQTPLPEGEVNPHFESPSPVSSTTVHPVAFYYGYPREELVLQRSQLRLENFLEEITTGRLCNKCVGASLQKYRKDVWDYRTSFMGVRIPNGWPIGLREIYCEICTGFHTGFRHGNLHPLLSFLEDMDSCWKGSGGKIYMRISTVHDYEARLSCWDDYMAMELYYARSLKKAVEVMQRCGLQQDLIAKPLVTDLVMFISAGKTQPEFILLQNAGGVQMKQMLTALIFYLHRRIMSNKRHMPMHKPDIRHWGTWLRAGLRLDQKIHFPQYEDFAAYVEGWPDIIQRYVDVANEIDELMKGIEGWGWEEWPKT